MPNNHPLRLAVAQIAPVLLDRDATLEKIGDSVEEAARGGAQLICFGEALAPGYPVWIERTDGARFDGAAGKDLHSLYLEQAVCIEAGHLDDLKKLAAARGLAISMGIIERPPERGMSLYCSSVYIDPSGVIQSVHRKLMPTFEERLSWSPGDGHGLRVHDLAGFRVGALNCWENWMPLARASLQAQGETLHVMHWPGALHNTAPTTQFIAREGRSYAVSVSGLLREQDIPAGLIHRDQIAPKSGELILNGGSCVADPCGEWSLEPLVGVESLRFCELDPGLVRRERQSFDPAGHYSRPDVLSLRVNRNRQQVATFVDAEENEG